ncbi:MAG TPA: hypothetical protein VGW57_07615 [Chthoniobacterales bacterium]|nr:hypothetical protein [Chthoniobacterales bacterium]
MAKRTIKTRDDFDAATKIALAERVGHRCSRPDCGQVTVGPSDESPNARSRIGVAAHIAAAAPGTGARRYDSTMSSNERRSISNGIWLCQKCAKLIDTDEIRFPAVLLHEWRRQAELRAREQLERGGESLPRTRPEFCAWVRLISDPPQFQLVVNVWLHNVGDKSAGGVRVRLEHCDTHTRAGGFDEGWWKMTAPSLNPWNLECTKDIHPDERVPVVTIPFREMPIGEIWVTLRLTGGNMKPWESSCRMSPAGLDLSQVQRVSLTSG